MITSRILKFILAGLGIAAAIAIALGAVYFSRTLASLPKGPGALAKFDAETLSVATEILDANDQVIGEIADERRYYVKLGDIPSHVQQAFISAEDKDFFRHRGVDFLALLRAVYKNFRRGQISQGASTITQQLARAQLLSPKRTYQRKIQEIALALALERRFSKRQILELYLNRIYLGNRAYGVEAAARNYFDKSVRDLNIGEAALLAALPKAPSKYAINRNYAVARKRQRLVLKEMERNGFIDHDAQEFWSKRAIAYQRIPKSRGDFGAYFIAEVKREVARKFEDLGKLPTKGLRIYTTLRPEIQVAASAAGKALLRTHVKAPASALANHLETASIAIDPVSGAILSVQGGSKFSWTEFNRAFHTRRELGDIFLPVYVGLAIDNGYTLATPVDVDPMDYRSLKPVKSIFPSVYEILTQSDIENGTVLMAAMGSGTVAKFVTDLGFRFASHDLRLAIGRGWAAPVELAKAFAIYANGGVETSPYLIRKIVDRRGSLLYQRSDFSPRQMIRPETSEIMKLALRDNVTFGEAKLLDLPSGNFSGAVGVTEDLKNGWIVAFRENLLIAMWLGHDRERVAIGRDRDDARSRLGKMWKEFSEVLPAAEVASRGQSPGLSFYRLKVERDDGTFEGRMVPFALGTGPANRLVR